MIEGKKSRKRYSGEDKAQFVLYCLSANCSVASSCRERQIASGNFYRWRKIFIDAGILGLKNGVKRAPKTTHDDKANCDNTILHKSRLIARYSNCLRASYFLGSRLPTAAKLEIIDMIEETLISKTEALKLIGVPRATYYSWLMMVCETGNAKNLNTVPNRDLPPQKSVQKF